MSRSRRGAKLLSRPWRNGRILLWKTGGFLHKKWDSTLKKGGLTRVSTVDYKLFIDCVDMGIR